ncbi:MAG TPA: M48 family metalloprotease [Chloroflexota bacterium]|nr:M48 family metalloprotease [Chloroflexota bacterium]
METRAEWRAPVLDVARQRLATRYGQQKRSLLLAESFLALAYVVAWQLALSYGHFRINSAGGVIVLFLLLVLIFEGLSFPMAFLGFQLSRGYGLSVQSMRGWLVDQVKALGLALLFGGGLVELAYFFMRLEPALWWLLLAAVVFVFTVALANLAPVLIAPLFYTFTPLEDAHLKGQLLALAARAGTHVRGVFTMQLSDKTTEANAAVMGWGNTRRIVIGDTLVGNFPADETEAVLAHELGHHVHHDIWKSLLLETAVTVLTFWIVAQLYGLAAVVGWVPPLPDAAGMPLLALLLGALSAVFAPLTRGFSRHIEHQADVYALRLASNPAAFTGSMIRLANQNLAEVDPPRWVEVLLYDHPAIGRRIRLFQPT